MYFNIRVKKRSGVKRGIVAGREKKARALGGNKKQRKIRKTAKEDKRETKEDAGL